MMVKIIGKLQYYSLFYKATFRRSLLVTSLVGGLASINAPDAAFIFYTFVWIFPTLGLTVDIAYRFLMRKNEFYFYHNASCSVFELYLISFMISSFLSLLFYHFAMFLWKCI